MNRAQRRAAKYQKAQPAKTYRLHKALTSRAAFEQIERLIDTVDTGEWIRYEGEVWVKRNSDEYYPAVPALLGFLEYWQAAEKRFGLSLDLAPLQQLIRELGEDAAGIESRLIDDNRRLLAELKRHYIRLPIEETRRLADDVKLAQLLDENKQVLGTM